MKAVTLWHGAGELHHRSVGIGNLSLSPLLTLFMWYGQPVESTVEPETEDTLMMQPWRGRSAS